MAAPIRRRGFLGALGAGLLWPPRASAATRLTFGEILRDDSGFTDKARALAGQDVEIRGYMAPPLKPEINFFILTALPAAVCPFCDSEASWPDDIVLVQLVRPVHAISYDMLIRATGVLDIGAATDPATGFVSRVRVRDARYVKA